MFLGILNDREGRNFIELAEIALQHGEDTEEREKDFIETYKREMAIFDYKSKNRSLDELITEFKASTKKIKRSVFIELAGVMNLEEEKDSEWINNLGTEFGFRETEMRKMIRWTEDFNDLIDEAYEYINKK